MASIRYRYIGETPVNVPDMNWGYDDNPVMPGDVSPPYDGEVNSTVIVPVGSKEEAAWLKAQQGGPGNFRGEAALDVKDGKS